MSRLNSTQKQRIRNDVIKGARNYYKYLVPYKFLIITEDGDANIFQFNKADFIHLAGISSMLSDKDFFDNCLKGTLSENNIKDEQHYNFGTIKRKITRLKNIHRIIYANASTNLILINLYTNTACFPFAIESIEDKTVVAFRYPGNNARSLRNNNHTDSDNKKSIVAIFSKAKNQTEKYSNLVYLRNHAYLDNVSFDILSQISVNIINKLYNSKAL